MNKPTKAQIEARARANHEELVRGSVKPPNTPVTWAELPEWGKQAARSQARAELEEGV